MIKEISVQDFREKKERGEEFVLFDVREQYEFDESNLGGILIPLGTLMDVIPTLEIYKTKEIIVHCRSGARSAMAVELLISAGFEQSKNLVGGINAWHEING